jgi:phenylacetate-CoA ligase
VAGVTTLRQVLLALTAISGFALVVPVLRFVLGMEDPTRGGAFPYATQEGVKLEFLLTAFFFGPYLLAAFIFFLILYLLVRNASASPKFFEAPVGNVVPSEGEAGSAPAKKAIPMEFYDNLETLGAAEREQFLFRRLPRVVEIAKTAPGWAGHLEGIDPKFVSSRSTLAELPILRKSDLVGLHRQTPPFGGFNVTAPGKLVHLMMSPGPIFEPEGHEDDYAGVARAMFAAGFRPGHIVHNCFSYHLTPGAWMFESGARALGCAVIPGGTGNTEQQVEAIAHLKPDGYVGTPDFLKVLLDTAQKSGKDVSSLKRGLVSGAAFPASLRQELSDRGVEVLQCYAIAEVGVIAYETPAREGLVVNENIIVEIVRPGTGDPVPEGEVGEVVVTSFSPHYPMIRLATGDLSAIMPGRSPCGRTNMRIRGWMGRADQTTKVKGMFVRPEQVAEVAKRHPELGRLRLVVSRQGEQDAMTLQAECAAPADGLADAVAASLQAVTKLKGAVALVPPGSLANDGKVIADERPIG